MTDPSQARDVESLRAAIAGGAQAEYLCFWGHTAKGARAVGPWVLSQWFEAPFEVDGVRYPTAEHWMMAGKAELFGDAQSREQILRASSSREAKALGRRVRGSSRPVTPPGVDGRARWASQEHPGFRPSWVLHA
ncbi:MAG: NADAR family protein [Myxococcota bacterium]